MSKWKRNKSILFRARTQKATRKRRCHKWRTLNWNHNCRIYVQLRAIKRVFGRPFERIVEPRIVCIWTQQLDRIHEMTKSSVIRPTKTRKTRKIKASALWTGDSRFWFHFSQTKKEQKKKNCQNWPKLSAKRRRFVLEMKWKKVAIKVAMKTNQDDIGREEKKKKKKKSENKSFKIDQIDFESDPIEMKWWQVFDRKGNRNET